MKKRILWMILAFLLCILCIYSLVNKNQKTFSYHPIVQDHMNDFVIEDGQRYIILYDTQKKLYYISGVGNSGLKDELYLLGSQVYNFNGLDGQTLMISSEQETIYISHDKIVMRDENRDEIVTVGALILSYDVKQEAMQVLSRKWEVQCLIPIQQYDHFIPIDLIEVVFDQ